MGKTFRKPNYCYSSFEDDEWRIKRDKKKFFKPNKKFKKAQKQARKAKEKQAIKTENFDNIPEFKRGDGWGWA